MRTPALAVLLLAAACGGAAPAAPEAATGDVSSRLPPASPSAASAPTASATLPAPAARVELERAQGEPRVEVVATGLEIPWDLTFLPEGQVLLTERPGRVRLIDADGTLRPEPVARVDVDAAGEGGLLGIDTDPDFDEGQRFVYLYVTTSEGMEVQRWRVGQDAESMSFDVVVLDGILAGEVHDSGRLRFGPEGDLWVLTGDAGQAPLAQDPDSLNGKVLRLPPEQYRATSEAPRIVSLGHRNAQGLDWQPGTGRLVITEHGPSGFDGPVCCDEVNVVEEGANYGWPRVFGEDHGRFRAPVFLWQRPPIAPSGAAFVSLPGSSWTGSYVLAALRGRALHRLTFDAAEVTGEQVLFQGEYGRLRAVVEGPDGALYVTTSNRDGRGEPVADDDRLLRVVPPAG